MALLKDVPIILLGFGNVGQSLVKLLADNDGYVREGVRLTLHSVFDRKGGVVATGQDEVALRGQRFYPIGSQQLGKGVPLVSDRVDKTADLSGGG